MPAKQKKAWTVMVYLAGDNNLDDAGVNDLKEMKKAGSSTAVNVVAQFDRAGSKGTTRRYFLRRGGTLARDVVADLGETNTGDPAVLREFVLWGAREYPAEHILLVLWNHGSGWDDEDLYRMARTDLGIGIHRRGVPLGRRTRAAGSVSVRRIRAVGSKRMRRALFAGSVAAAIRPGLHARAIAFDDSARDFLDNRELKKVLLAVTRKLGRRIDILGMDACLMSMAEVGYQLRGVAAFTVGSEETEPNDGWPYDTILTALARKPGLSPAALSELIVKKYLASYSALDGVTMAACDLGRAQALAARIDALAGALRTALSDPATRQLIVMARAQVQEYEMPDYVDLHDLCERLLANAAVAPDACRGVMEMLRAPGYVITAGCKGSAVRGSHGLSIYFPRRSVSSLYAGLDFQRATAWGRFLGEYVSLMR